METKFNDFDTDEIIYGLYYDKYSITKKVYLILNDNGYIYAYNKTDQIPNDFFYAVFTKISDGMILKDKIINDEKSITIIKDNDYYNIFFSNLPKNIKNKINF